jgi:hypothetical protein
MTKVIPVGPWTSTSDVEPGRAARKVSFSLVRWGETEHLHVRYSRLYDGICVVGGNPDNTSSIGDVNLGGNIRSQGTIAGTVRGGNVDDCPAEPRGGLLGA